MIVFGLLPVNLFANAEQSTKLKVACSHPQVCRLIDWMYPNQSISTIFPIGEIAGDPHHFEPSPSDLRGLLDQKVLITAPIPLQPWVRGVVRQRARNSEARTLTLNTSEIEKKYKSSTRESLAHFWLFPDAICSMANQIHKFIGQEQEELELHINKEINCDALNQRIASSFKNYREKKNYPVVITHDALTPLFQEHDVEHLTLRSSGHGDRVNSRHIRRLENLIGKSEETPLVWIEEDQIFKNPQIQARKREMDITLNLTTDGPVNYQQKDKQGDDFLLPLKQLKGFLNKNE